jgi:hypothetical protein
MEGKNQEKNLSIARRSDPVSDDVCEAGCVYRIIMLIAHIYALCYPTFFPSKGMCPRVPLYAGRVCNKTTAC